MLVVQGREQLAGGGQGVGDDSTPHTGVDGLLERADTHPDVGHPAQRVGQRGPADLVVDQIGQHDHVAVELIRPSLEQGGQVR
jgi:hypothetical protein